MGDSSEGGDKNNNNDNNSSKSSEVDFGAEEEQLLCKDDMCMKLSEYKIGVCNLSLVCLCILLNNTNSRIFNYKILI